MQNLSKIFKSWESSKQIKSKESISKRRIKEFVKNKVW